MTGDQTVPGTTIIHTLAVHALLIDGGHTLCFPCRQHTHKNPMREGSIGPSSLTCQRLVVFADTTHPHQQATGCKSEGTQMRCRGNEMTKNVEMYIPHDPQLHPQTYRSPPKQ